MKMLTEQAKYRRRKEYSKYGRLQKMNSLYLLARIASREWKKKKCQNSVVVKTSKVK